MSPGTQKDGKSCYMLQWLSYDIRILATDVATRDQDPLKYIMKSPRCPSSVLLPDLQTSEKRGTTFDLPLSMHAMLICGTKWTEFNGFASLSRSAIAKPLGNRRAIFIYRPRSLVCAVIAAWSALLALRGLATGFSVNLHASSNELLGPGAKVLASSECLEVLENSPKEPENEFGAALSTHQSESSYPHYLSHEPVDALPRARLGESCIGDARSKFVEGYVGLYVAKAIVLVLTWRSSSSAGLNLALRFAPRSAFGIYPSRFAGHGVNPKEGLWSRAWQIQRECVENRALLSSLLSRFKVIMGRGIEDRAAEDEPIAIVGMGCRFSGIASTPEGLWRMVTRGVSSWSSGGSNRFNLGSFWHPKAELSGSFNAQGVHLLRGDPAFFDNEFFSISGAEAKAIDPQQRIMLEVAYEAFENAGMTMDQLKGSRTGVYCSISNLDYEQMLGRDPDASPKYDRSSPTT
ncbi:hypothetical protein ACLMJK_008220 [Lecanora helva]